MGEKLSLKTGQNQQNFQLLQGRITTAKWLSMHEPEVAREVAQVESDPLFGELMHGIDGQNPIFKRKRWPASSLHSGYYEFKEELASGSGDGDIQDLLEDHGDLVHSIKKIGVAAFEKHFLYGEENKPLPAVCQNLNISLEEGKRILDLVLTVGARSEFFHPSPTPETSGIRFHCIAAIENDPRDPEALYFQFLSPHWARGQYIVQYEKLSDWKKRRNLSVPEKKRLRRLLKQIELLNMRQDTLFQILSRITTEQSAFLRSRKNPRLRPLSLRELARRIGVAPSTVSRSVSNRSIRTPWGEELPMKSLLVGQRAVIVAILTDWAVRGGLDKNVTDEELTTRLAEESAISVSRRTVNDCRRLLSHAD